MLLRSSAITGLMTLLDNMFENFRNVQQVTPAKQ